MSVMKQSQIPDFRFQIPPKKSVIAFFSRNSSQYFLSFIPVFLRYFINPDNCLLMLSAKS